MRTTKVTVEEFLASKDLLEEFKTEAGKINDMHYDIVTGIYPASSNALLGGFMWDHSEKGVEFWGKVTSEYEKITGESNLNR